MIISKQEPLTALQDKESRTGSWKLDVKIVNRKNSGTQMTSEAECSQCGMTNEVTVDLAVDDPGWH